MNFRLLQFWLLLLLPYGLADSEGLSVGHPVEPGAAADILVWTAWSGPSLNWLMSELDSFGRASAVSIAIEQHTLGELRRLMVLAEDSDRIADVLVGVPHDDIDELVDADLLLDASDYATADYLMDLPASASNAFNRGSKLLGLPLTLDGPALIVNTDLVANLPGTYHAFTASAARLDQGETSGFGFDSTNFYFAYAWFKGHGSSVFQTDTSELAINSDEGTRAATELQRLRFELGLLDQNSTYEQVHEQFAAGRLAYTFNGPWAISRYFETGVPLAIMPVPAAAQGVPFAGFMTVHGVLIAASTSNRTMAANVAKWLVRSESQLRLAEQAGRIPSSIRAVAALEDDGILHGFGLALRHAEATPTHSRMAAVWQPMGRFLQQLDAQPLPAARIRELLDEAAHEILAD